MAHADSWRNCANLAVRRQLALTVHQNEDGDVIVRQLGDFPEEDNEVIVAAPNVVQLVYALLNAAGLPMQLIEAVAGGWQDVPDTVLPAAAGDARPDTGRERQTSDATAAARQRRYRRRKRDGDRNANRDGATPDRDGDRNTALLDAAE